MSDVPRDKPPQMLVAEWVAIHNDIVEPNVFNPGFLKKLKSIVIELSSWRIDVSEARKQLAAYICNSGYTPESGFPDDSPDWRFQSIAGSIDDLRSWTRVDWTIRHQKSIVSGAAAKFSGTDEFSLVQFPAWELIPKNDRVVGNWRERWNELGGREFLSSDTNPINPQPALLALKGDPIWAKLGDRQIWPDALGIDHPPFYLDSGIQWRPIDLEEAIQFGLIIGKAREPNQSEAVAALQRRLDDIGERRRQLRTSSLDDVIRSRQEEYSEGPNLEEMIAREKERYKRLSGS
jgi:hypothetical protein